VVSDGNSANAVADRSLMGVILLRLQHCENLTEDKQIVHDFMAVGAKRNHYEVKYIIM